MEIKELPVSPDIWRKAGHGGLVIRVASYHASTFDLPLPFPMGVSTVYPIDIPTMKAKVQESEAAERRAVAQRFAVAAHKLPFVREVWFENSEEPTITVITHGAGLDDELRLEAVLTASDQPAESFDGFLRVYADDDVPSYARSGEKL